MKAEGKVEAVCDMADGGGKEQDCDSALKDSLDDKDMSEKDQYNQRPDEIASVHKDQNFKPESVDHVRSDLGMEKSKDEHGPTTEELYVASMLLSGVGDALGYHNGHWEFNTDGPSIHRELEDLGGLEKLHLKGKQWIVSDDTVMHLATADGMLNII